jgi:hypothetical protein
MANISAVLLTVPAIVIVSVPGKTRSLPKVPAPRTGFPDLIARCAAIPVWVTLFSAECQSIFAAGALARISVTAFNRK